MSPDPRPIVLGALLALHGVAAAAPAGDSSLVAKARLAQEISGDSSQAEALPVRPRGNPLRTSPASVADAPPDGKADKLPKEEAPTASKGTGCSAPGCTSCTHQVPTCKPKWEDKKTKKATFAMKCDFECTRPWEPYHQGNCCEEKTTPCGNVHTKKKLFKTEEEKVERVLKYEVVMKPAPPCCEPEPACCCFGCRSVGPAFARLFGWCH